MRSLSEASLAVARAVGGKWAVSISRNILATVALRHGDFATARSVAEESVVLGRHIGERVRLASSLCLMGQVATAEAWAALRESLLLNQDLGNRAGIAETLESIAALDATEAQSERAVQLAGAAAGIREQVGAALSPMRRAMLGRWLVPVRQALGAQTTTLAWEAGRNMAIEQALDLGPCAAGNNALLQIHGRSIWFKDLNDPALVPLVFDYAQAMLDADRVLPAPGLPVRSRLRTLSRSS